MRHPRVDLRTLFGSHVAEGTRAIVEQHQGEVLERLHPVTEGARAYARSPAALVRRRLEKSATSARGRRITPDAVA